MVITEKATGNIINIHSVEVSEESHSDFEIEWFTKSVMIKRDISELDGRVIRIEFTPKDQV
jgi:hypothetical protein